jgi:beta-lactamase superfamily II metal-dependent hydrolase
MNRFHHPNKDVIARYAAAKVDLADTARGGFIAIRFAPDSAPHIVER